MKDYHFQKGNQDFDQTVRLDAINEQVKQLKQNDADDELGDANAFLDAFESEKFDTPIEEQAEEGLGDTRKTEPVKRPLPPQEEADGEEWEEYEEEEGYFGLNKKTATLLAVLGVVACILGFSLVRCGFHPSKAPVEVFGEGSPMLVAEVLDAEEIIVYDIAEEEKKTLKLTEETKMTDAEGRSVAYGGVQVGDLFLAELDKDGETVLSVDYSDAAIETEEATGLEADTKKQTLSNAEETYAYGKKALFLYNEEEIRPGDLEPCDVLLLKLYEDMVWSVEVQEYHGYILVENAKNIKDGMLQLDEEEPIPLEEGAKLPAKEGSHTVTVTGSNIETRKDSLLVEAGKELEYDLSKAQEKVGVIIVDANVSDYKLYINGAAAESPAVLPLGEYDLVILKNGYTEWNQHVSLQQDSVTVHAELQRDIQYGTLTVTADVDGAWVSINGEEYGVAPMQVNLPYGSYNVTVAKSGYADFRQTIQIQGSASTLHATME
ncbi:MAG: PEGA domain-containing protein [Anaerotignum sp.]